jgi:hypothetical protein
MIYVLLTVALAAHTDSLLQSLLLLQDTLPVLLWPEFRPWDDSPLYYRNVLQGGEDVRLQVQSFQDTSVTSWRLSGSSWKAFKGEEQISGLQEGVNVLEVMNQWKDSNITYTVLLRSTSQAQLSGLQLATGHPLDCSAFSSSQLDYSCSPEVPLGSDLEILPTSSAEVVLEYRHVSLLDRHAEWKPLPSGGLVVPSFLNHTLEHVLEIKVTAESSSLYRFVISVPPSANKPTSMASMFDSASVPALYDWDLKPRLHPDVYSYTLTPMLSNKASLHMMWKFETPQSTPVYLYPSCKD